LFTLTWNDQFNSIVAQFNRAPLLEEWDHPFAGVCTQLRGDQRACWLYDPSLGAIQFDLNTRSICAYPFDGVGPDWFERFLSHEWLPLVYQAWGYQVLHASAAVNLSGGGVLAFSGPAGAGKSTLGYCLGRRPGWGQIADESLAMEVGASGLRLAPIPNYIRLRPASAAHYNADRHNHEKLVWPDIEPYLQAVFFLEPFPSEDDSLETPPRLLPLDGVQAYPLFLGQAFALTLRLPDHNKRLMRDYLHIARRVPAYQLSYSKSFSVVDQVLDVVEDLTR
jgi:hypothetical protein